MKSLKDIILEASRTLQPKINWADAECLLTAIATVESDYGQFNIPRHEPAYDVGGVYFKKSQLVRDNWKKYGAMAACSWSSFQIMFIVAAELGFPGSPIQLWDDETAIHWVTEYIQKRILSKGVVTTKEFAIAYNAGSPKSINASAIKYAEKFGNEYYKLLRAKRESEVFIIKA